MSPNADPAETQPRFTLGPWQSVAAGIFRAVAQPDAVTIGLIVGTESAMLVDTGSSPAQGSAIRAAVEEATDRPLTAVVVTHGHSDHLYGLPAFADVTTIGHESVPAPFVRLGVSKAPFTKAIAVATSLDLGDRRVEIAHLGEGHSASDLVIVVADANVVFAGDLIGSPELPSSGVDAVPGSWAATLDGVIGLMTADTILVPGHGDPVDREFVFEQRGRIAARAAELMGPPQPERPTLPLA